VPVRKVFAGKRPKMRFMTEAEVKENNRLWKQISGANFRPLIAKPATIDVSPYSKAAKSYARVAVSKPQQHRMLPALPLGPGGKRMTGDFRIVEGGKLADKQAEAWLTRRGKFEINSGRGLDTDSSGNTRVGGHLKRSLKLMYPSPSTAMRGSIYTRVSYAKYQELGTRHHAAQPFLRPGIWAVRERYRTEVISALRKIGTYKPSNFKGITRDKRSARPSKIKPQG
jgi:hypothetical protein